MSRPKSANPKSVLLAVRVTPRMRYGLELAARRSGRTVSQVVNRAVDALLASADEGLRLVPRGGAAAVDVLECVWSPHEHERIVRLAIMFPQLLSDDERYLWRQMCESPRYWVRGHCSARPRLADIDLRAVARDWPALRANARAGGTADVP